MVNNEISEEMLGEQGEMNPVLPEVVESTSSPPSSKAATSDKEEQQIDVKEVVDESLRLSPASLFCSVPINQDVQTIIDTFAKTENEKIVKKTRKLPCLYCERTFVADNLRQKHIERCHSIKQARRSSLRFQQSGTAVTCLFCNKFSLPDNVDNVLSDLFQHLLTEHPTRYFGCLPCKERFTLLSQLEEHNEDVHGIKRELKVQSNDESVDESVTSAINDVNSVKTKQRTLPSPPVEDDEEEESKSKPQSSLKETRNKRIGIKSTKLGVKKSVRLQSKVITTKSSKKKQKTKDKLEEPKTDAEREIKIPTHENPYPQFDAFYRVKKITDHSIDNIRIGSLTFTDVFDQAFFTRIKCNIRENLLNHIDGKLFKNEESESRISNFEKTEITTPAENYGCELSLNAVAPMSNLLTTYVGDDLESQIEYGSKASKKKITPKQDEVHYKYFTRRKYQASILESKENRDLAKLDMWTQYLIKTRQQKMLDTTKSDKEKQDYKKGDEYKAKVQNDELNRILDRRGPFEDLKEEANKKAALEGNFNQEANAAAASILDDILNSVFSKVTDEIEVKTELTDTEIPSYLNLIKASMDDERYVDKSDKITLICSSQETENFEAPQISPRDKNALAELTGEWTRSRLYICAACGLKVPNMRMLIDHKNFVHQNVWCQHYEFVGGQGAFYKHLSIPGLGKMGFIEENPVCKAWRRSDARNCTKCKKQCNTLGELHRHVLECGEDWSWMLVRKKCKYKPFGAKTRKKRRGLIKRIINKEKQRPENREKKSYKKEGPRSKPSDAETIQRMLANLPAKRATRKLICLKDGISRPRKNQPPPQTKSDKRSNLNASAAKAAAARRSRAEILLQESTKILKRKKVRKVGLKCNPVGNIRKSVRNLNKVISSSLIDNNSTIMMKRKLKNALQQRMTRATRRSHQFETKPATTNEIKENETGKISVKKTSKYILKKLKNFKKSKATSNEKPPLEEKPLSEKSIEEAETSSAKPSRSVASTLIVDKVAATKENIEKGDEVLDEINSPAKKRQCKKQSLGTKFIRKLSIRRKNKVEAEKQVENTSEGKTETKETGKRKFGSLKNVVKKMKLNKKSNQDDSATAPPKSQNKAENLVNIIGGHFLEQDSNEKSVETVTVLKNLELNSENIVVSNLTKTICDEDNISLNDENSKALSHKGSTEDLKMNDEQLNDKGKSSKNKVCKRAKGLNACIAMLTSKLAQKEDTHFPSESSKFNSENEIILNTPTVAKISQVIIEQNASHEWISKDLPLNEKDETCEAAIPEAINQPFEIKEDIIEESKTVSSTMASPILEHEKENIELEEKSIESLVTENKAAINEKVADVIKRFDNITSNENFTDILTNHVEFSNNKSIRKIGANRKRPIRNTKTIAESEIATTIDDRLNIAILADEDPLFCYAEESNERKIGQKRILSKRKLKSPTPAEEANDEIPEIPETLIKKDLSAITEENIILNDIECQSFSMKNVTSDIIKTDLYTPSTDHQLTENKSASKQNVDTNSVLSSTVEQNNDNLNSSKANILIEQEFDDNSNAFINSNVSNETNSSETSDEIAKSIDAENNLSEIASNLNLENEPDILESKLVIENSLKRTIVIANDASDSEDEIPLAVLKIKSNQIKIIPDVIKPESNIEEKAARIKAKRLENLKKRKKKRNDKIFKAKNKEQICAAAEVVMHCNKPNNMDIASSNVNEVVSNTVSEEQNKNVLRMEQNENEEGIKQRIENELAENESVETTNEKSKVIDSIYELNEAQEVEKEIITNEIISDNSKENMNDHESPKRLKRKSIKYSTIDFQEQMESESYFTPLKENKNTDIQNESFIQTPDLNDSIINNKLATKLKIKRGKKTKSARRRDNTDENSVENFCEICSKRFVRNDSLIKHKRTLTHIAKLSEIEAKEAAAKAEAEAAAAAIAAASQIDSESVEIVNSASELPEEESQDNDEKLQVLEFSNDTNEESIKSTSEMVANANNDAMKLADIISNVLKESPLHHEQDNFSNVIEKPEPKRYKSLGERKSFDSDSIIYNTIPQTYTSHLNQITAPPDEFLEKQISILENMIEENKSNFQYIDEISNKSEERCPSDMSLVSDIKQDDSNIIAINHNPTMVNELVYTDGNFIKPTQYEEISEDSLNTRNFDDNRLRKTLNRDEELFLECCSLLKSSSEMSNYSKKSTRTISMVNNCGLKMDEEQDWMERKNLSPKHKVYMRDDDEYMSDSCPNTPIDNTYNDLSNSNTIESNWNSTLKDKEDSSDSVIIISDKTETEPEPILQKCVENKLSDFDDENMDSITFRKNINARFGNLMAEALKSNNSEAKKLHKHRKKIKNSFDNSQPSIKEYTVPITKEIESLDAILNDKKSFITKGAKKVFEGLKVSIPTEELDMKEVLNCSPTSKRLEIEGSDFIKDDKCERRDKTRHNLNKFGNKLGLKVTKKRNKIKSNCGDTNESMMKPDKVHDVYDFEETQDNTDVCYTNNLLSFRTQAVEKIKDDDYNEKDESEFDKKQVESNAGYESDSESNNHYMDSFSFETQSVSSISTEESSNSLKKNRDSEIITKKKTVIMGRIFKNAFKPKSDCVKEMQCIEENKLVENCFIIDSNPKFEDAKKESRGKMTEQEMNLLFDKLLEDNASTNKSKLGSNSELIPPKQLEIKQIKHKPKTSIKHKKRMRKMSESSDDEFNLSKTPKKRTIRKKAKDDEINLEQEIKECMGVAGRKSQRKCTSGKQNVLVEVWSSDDSDFEAMLKNSLAQSSQQPNVPPANDQTESIEIIDDVDVECNDDVVEIESTTSVKETISEEHKVKPRKRSITKTKLPKMKAATTEETLAANRRKRAAADTLYYWSSSSEDEAQNLIEVKSIRDENEDDEEDRPMQHGWIVGDSPKKLVTMLAQAKGKKVDAKQPVKEQTKKRTTI